MQVNVLGPGQYGSPDDLHVVPSTTRYLPRCVTTTGERRDLLSFLSTPEGSRFLEPSLVNNGVIVEVNESTESKNEAAQLVSAGELTEERAELISEMHFVFHARETTPTELHEQAYVLKDGKFVHYTHSFSDFITYAYSFERAVRIYLYDNRLDHSNHLFVVINNNLRDNLSSPIDWNAFNDLLKKPSVNLGNANRQKSKRVADYGFTGSVCTSRNVGPRNGVAQPVLKPGSKDPNVAALFVAATEFVTSQDLPFLPPGQMAMTDPAYPQRIQNFGAQIHEANQHEQGRASESTVQETTGAHTDKMNSDVPSMGMVVGLSVTLRCHVDEKNNNESYLVRRLFNASGRKSIDDTLNREERDLPMVRHISDGYSATPAVRRSITTQILDGPQVEFFPGVPMIRNDCNFDATSFHQPYIYYILLLTDKFNLSYPETIGVQTAMEFIPNTCLFFVLACKCVLESWESTMQYDRRAVGFELGYVIVKLMKEFHRMYTGQETGSRRRENYRRYATYVGP